MNSDYDDINNDTELWDQDDNNTFIEQKTIIDRITNNNSATVNNSTANINNITMNNNGNKSNQNINNEGDKEFSSK